MSTIDIKRQYRTRNGAKVELYVLHLNNPFEYQIMGATQEADGTWTARYWRGDGRYSAVVKDHHLDLIEAGPYDHIKIDDKVLVWHSNQPWAKFRGYFAGLSPDGQPMIWPHGGTSWSRVGERPVAWGFCTKVED